jgi:hypothetical protein
MTDRAIDWIKQQKALMPDKPFFVYFAPGATHAPHHVPKEWSDRYRGAFDDGWDALRERTFARQKELGVIPPDAELTERPAEIPAWDDMPDDLMNGAFGLETTEFMVSRIDDFGTPAAYNHYAVGWAHAMDTPYQWTKQIASHWGGTRNGTIVHWPHGIQARGEVRAQFHHVIDVAPTVLEAAGFVLYVKDGRPAYCYNLFGLQQFKVYGEEPIPAGEHQVRMEFAYDGGGLGKGGIVTLYVDGEEVGEGRVDGTVPMLFSADETTDVGSDTATPVSDGYGPRDSAFTGTVRWVQLDIDEAAEDADHLVSPEERFRIAMARQ